jgi:hypothetical protein
MVNQVVQFPIKDTLSFTLDVAEDGTFKVNNKNCSLQGKIEGGKVTVKMSMFRDVAINSVEFEALKQTQKK